MSHVPKGRDWLKRAEICLLYILLKATDEHKRKLLWDFEVIAHSHLPGQRVREVLRAYALRSGMVMRQRAPTSNHKGWLWCGESSIEDYLYDILKNHQDRILPMNPAFPDRPGWSPDEILALLEKRKEENVLRESEGGTTATDTEQRETEQS